MAKPSDYSGRGVMAIGGYESDDPYLKNAANTTIAIQEKKILGLLNNVICLSGDEKFKKKDDLTCEDGSQAGINHAGFDIIKAKLNGDDGLLKEASDKYNHFQIEAGKTPDLEEFLKKVGKVIEASKHINSDIGRGRV